MAFRNIKKYFGIFLQLQKINLMKRMAYPVSSLLGAGAILLTMIFSILFININYNFINNLAGWNYYDALAVVGSYMIIEGVMWAFMGQLNSINANILNGTLDSILLRPIDDQFFASFWRGDTDDVVRLITGIVLIVVSIKNTIGFNFVHLIIFASLLFNGAVILYSFNLMIRSASFWIIDGTGLWFVMEKITNNSIYPVDIYYNKIVRSILTFIIPLAFVSTVPAKILTNILIDWRWVGLSFLMCFIFFFSSRMFWKFALKHYSSASS